MDFSARLIQLRHERSLTQQALADAVNIHVNQIRRHEAGVLLDSLILKHTANRLSSNAQNQGA